MGIRMNALAIGIGTALALTAGAGAALGQAGGPGDDPPVTLHLADADPGGQPSEIEAAWFAQRVHELSDGTITVEVTQDAGADLAADLGPEAAVARLVEAGDAELGMTTARPWDLIGVTSLQALQAPLLIDNTALAVEVARSDIAAQALEGMADAGLTGLALWPEHLRYLFAYPPSGKVFLSPDDVAGTTLISGFSASGWRFLSDLGATIWDGTDREGDIDSGVLAGGELGFFNGPANAGWTTATGNLVFYPRTKVLFANSDALASLTEGQQAIIRQAAEETREHAIQNVADEADQAVAHCSQDGHVVFATDEAIGAFHAAAQPTITALREDPLTSRLIDAITELKAVTLPSAGVQPCDPPAGTALYPIADPEGFSATLPPPGAYRADVTYETMVANGVADSWARGNQGLSTFTFTEDRVTFEAMNPDGRHVCHASAAVTPDGRAVHLTDVPGGSCTIGMDILWKPEGDGIRMILSADPGARGTPGQIEEHLNTRGWLEPIRWVKIQ